MTNGSLVAKFDKRDVHLVLTAGIGAAIAAAFVDNGVQKLSLLGRRARSTPNLQGAWLAHRLVPRNGLACDPIWLSCGLRHGRYFKRD